MNIITIENIDIELSKKKIKNIHLSVHPPDGRVKLSVPEQMNDEDVRTFVISKLPWLNKQRKKFSLQKSQTENKFESGETHHLFGTGYLLNVVETKGRQHAELRNDKYIDLYVKPGTSAENREKLLYEWYRQYLKEIIPLFINKWEDIIGVKVNEFGVKRMKTRWGTCNIRDKRIWLNLELAKKNCRCLEYIIVHEMVHLLERNHNQNFKNYMNKFLPDWKNIKDELNGLTVNNK